MPSFQSAKMSIGVPLIRWRRLVLAVWLAGTAALAVFGPGIDPSANEQTSFLPADSPHSQAVAAMRREFPASSGLSEAVVVFERRNGPLTAADLAVIEDVAGRIARPGRIAGADDLAGIRVRSPGSFVLQANPLKSPPSADGQAALTIVSIPANFITMRSDRVVDHIYEVLGSVALPEGLAVAVTGSSGFGHDYADAAEDSHRKTLIVTLIAVVMILLVVYRAPAAALVPLTAISLAALVAMKVLAVGQYLGMQVGTAEKIFVIVLLYGAGTDYSLFYISRFREFLGEGLASAPAAARALDATFPAILASAGTDTAGLLMLCFADYGIFRTTGPAVAAALVVALLAATTVVPAMVAVGGARLFWPARPDAKATKTFALGGKRLWPRVARLVAARPATVLVVALIVLAVPTLRGARLTWVYDTLTALRTNREAAVGNAAVGIEAAKRHWPAGEIAPVQVMIECSRPRSEDQWRRFVERLTGRFTRIEGVRTVRSLTQPLGGQCKSLAAALIERLGRAKISAEYLSQDMRATRLVVVLDSPAFSLAAMESVKRVRGAAQKELAAGETPLASGARVYIAGATAEMIDTRSVTQSDFYRIAALSLAVIFVMVVVLLRDAILSAFMVASTVLSYFATLGVSYWFFVGLLGQQGLDWKVEVFLFVVMVAVGVDYNIFLSSRLCQEARRLPAKLATARAVIHTGPVISSCGVIMAATLGSLMAGDLELLRQLGFALACGMLIDTFLVRPLLLPAFVVLTGRTGKALGLGH